MINIHERAIESATTTLLLEDARWGSLLAEYLQAITAGRFDQWYVDALMQAPPSMPFTIYDAFCLATIHRMILLGEIVTAQVQLDRVPRNDKAIEWNNTPLRASRGCPFVGEFCGGAGDSDGWFAWVEPIEMGQLLADGSELTYTIDPMQVPLEVGYTKGSVTLQHILTEWGLARWPYNSETLYLFVLPDRCQTATPLLPWNLPISTPPPVYVT